MAFFLRTLKEAPKRLLISRTDRIGDFVLTLPVFKEIKSHLDLHLAVLCNEMVVPLLKNNPYVDEIIPISEENQPLQMANQINNRQFDAMLVLVNDPVIQKILPLINTIDVRIGPLSKPKALFHFTHPVVQKRSRSVQNEAEYNLELLKIFSLQPQEHRPKLYVTEDEIRETRIKFADIFDSVETKIVVLHAGMSGSALNMKDNFYQDLLTRLVERGYTVLLTGHGDSESLANQRLITAFNGSASLKPIDLSNRLNLRELCVLLSLSDLFIGPSTGPTHLANAAQIPVISFYPPIKVQSATRWQPFLSDGHIFTPEVSCKQKFNCIGHKCKDYFCMDLIKVDEVFQKILLILDR